jgi:hypothetical protein
VGHFHGPIRSSIERLKAGNDFARCKTWIWNLLSVASATAFERLRPRRKSYRGISESWMSDAI